jgi:hypothetical protein
MAPKAQQPAEPLVEVFFRATPESQAKGVSAFVKGLSEIGSGALRVERYLSIRPIRLLPTPSSRT